MTSNSNNKIIKALRKTSSRCMGHVNRFQILKVETADLLVTSKSRSHILRFCCCQGRERYRQTDIDTQTYMHTNRERETETKTEGQRQSQRVTEKERRGGGGGGGEREKMITHMQSESSSREYRTLFDELDLHH